MRGQWCARDTSSISAGTEEQLFRLIGGVVTILLFVPPSHSASEVVGLLTRVSSLVLLAVLILWFAERRWNVVSHFLAEPRTALDLAVFRIALMTIYVGGLDPAQVVRFARLDPALIVPPFAWGHLAVWWPRNVALVETLEVVFCLFSVLALVGLWTRFSVVVSVLSGSYLGTICQLFGKINHGHDMVLFGLLLACSPAGDALSLDSLLARRRGVGVPQLATSRRYALPLQAVMVLMGVTYFFPGAWKVSRLGLEWFRATHLQTLIANKVAESAPSHLQLWMLHQPTLLSIGAFFTIVFEMGWILLVIPRRTRPLAFLMGLGFHNMTNLMMNIPFWNLQFCYVALVDWGAVLTFFSSRISKTEAVARQVAQPKREDWWESITSRALPKLAMVLVAAMVLAGIGHIGNGWPIACYPTFDDRFETPEPKVLTLEGHTSGGASVDETLSYDRVLQARYRADTWRGMTEAEGCPGTRESEPRARALVGLWQGVHPETRLASATVYCDVYEGTIDSARKTQHLLVRTVQLQAPATH